MTNSRLPHKADTLPEVTQYYRTRARQFLHQGWRWSGQVADLGGAYRTEFSWQGQPYASYYLPPQAWGKGQYRKLLAKEPLPIVTTLDCQIVGILLHIGHPFQRVVGVLDSAEYGMVSEFYGDQRAKRSQVFLMNHIDEGLAIMAATGASEVAQRAYCLHPLLQGDADLAANLTRVSEALAAEPEGALTLALALEYRNVANAYLSAATMPTTGIRLSPVPEVNAMLVGDKVQNRKDFELYHAQTHAKRIRLAEYFREWCAALGIAEPQYQQLIANLPTD